MKWKHTKYWDGKINITKGTTLCIFFIVMFSFPALLPSSPRHPKCLSHRIACSLNIEVLSMLLLLLSAQNVISLPLPSEPSLISQVECNWNLECLSLLLSHMLWDLGSFISTAWIKILFTYPICLLSRLWASEKGGLTSLWIPGPCLLENECVCSWRDSLSWREV